MSKILINLLAVAAIASPAAAADKIVVNLVGKTPEAIHSEIVRAAYKVCSDSADGSFLAQYYIGSCVRDAVRRAEASLAQASTARSEKLAMAR